MRYIAIIVHFVGVGSFAVISPLAVMSMALRLASFLLFLFAPFIGGAQQDNDAWHPVPAQHYGFVQYDENVISQPHGLDSFFYKLQALRHNHSGRVNVIHIGDSHTQADGVTAVMRLGLQEYFGNAGRGLVFPYQLANSNAPHDIRSSSNTSWKSNRLTSPDKPIATGISGYGIHSANQNATVNIGLKDMDGRQERFNRMVFFLCNDNVCYRMSDSNLASPFTFNTTRSTTENSFTVNTDSMITSFQLAKVSSATAVDYSFYGVSLEKRDTPGVLYHTIGVNGARYDQFLPNDLFWSQLKDLDGDLFIVSLGTNEAQNPTVNEAALSATCDSFVRKIHRIAPYAAVLITTPAGSYYRKKKPNKSIQNVADALKRYCTTAHVPYWDLLDVSGGVPGTLAWKKLSLISQDLVHYNNAGYYLQGQLLLNAVAKSYNAFDKAHPYAVKKATIPAKPTPPIKVIKTEVVKAKLTPEPAKAPEPKKPEAPPPPKPVVPDEQPTKPGSNIKVQYEW